MAIDVPSEESADVAGYVAALALCRQRAPAWHFASFFLSRDKRRASCALLALLIQVADAFASEKPADNPSNGSVQAATSSCADCENDGLLKIVRGRLCAVGSGQLELPLPEFRDQPQHILYAASIAVRRYQIPETYLLQFAEACANDRDVVRHATWSSLERHCRAVGGAAALMVGLVLGLTSSDAARQFIAFGSALRLTAILRAVGRDWDRGRVYLPLEDLARFRYSERDLAAGTINENFRSLAAFEIQRARQLYREGAEGICWLAGDSSRLAAAMIAVTGLQELRALERHPSDALKPPRSTRGGQFPLTGLRSLAQAWRLARRRQEAPLPQILDL